MGRRLSLGLAHARAAPRKSSYGFPLFELAGSLLLIGVFALVFAYAIEHVLERTEATVVKATVMNIRSGLRLEKARRLLSGAAPVAAGINPIQFLAIPPQHYAEEVRASGQTPQAGSWRYRDSDHTLYYWPQYHLHLRLLSHPGEVVLAWRIETAAERPQEADLVTVTKYEWL